MVTDATIAAVATIFMLVVVLAPTLLLALANLVAMVREPELPAPTGNRNGVAARHVRRIGVGS